MCFSWLKKIYQYLTRKCRRRNRGYSHEISSHGSFYCGGEGSVVYSRRPSYCVPVPRSSTHSITGGYNCSGEGSVVITSGDSRGTYDWGVTVGTVPAYGRHGAIAYSSEDLGPRVTGVSGGGEGSSCHGGSLSIPAGGGYGYEYNEPPRDHSFPTYGSSGGSGYHSGGSDYGVGGYSCPRLSSDHGGSSQAMQQKCPVVVPDIEPEQIKQSSKLPPIQKK